MTAAELGAAMSARFTNTTPRSEDYRLGWADGYSLNGARPGADAGTAQFDAYMSGHEHGRASRKKALRDTMIDSGMVPA